MKDKSSLTIKSKHKKSISIGTDGTTGFTTRRISTVAAN